MRCALACLRLILGLSFALTACAPPDTAPSDARESATLQATSPPTVTVFLSELQPADVSVGAGSLGVGLYPLSDEDMHQGTPINAQGRDWRKGLFAHAPSRLRYDLQAAFTSFTTSVLLEDYPRGLCGGDGVVFRVLLDGAQVFESRTMAYDTPPERVELDVTGVRELLLIVDSRQDTSCDYAIWGDPFLVSAGGSIPIPTAEQQVMFYPTAVPADLPCAQPNSREDFLFLDCDDILRMRAVLASSGPALAVWSADRRIVDNYRGSFPGQYDPDMSSPILWWGQGNYIAQDMALIYLVTGDRAYAADLRRLLEKVRSHTANPPHLVAYGAEHAGGLLAHPRHSSHPFSSLLFGYFAIRGTDLFTEQEREDFDDFFVNQGFLAYEAIAEHGGRIALESDRNRNVPHAAAIVAATMAAAFPDHPRSQELYDLVWPELEWQISHWYHADGGWGEDVERYGFTRMYGLLLLAETLQRHRGADMYAMDFGGRSLQTLCRHYLRIVTPEGISPMLNDTPPFWMDPGVLRLCANRTGDAELAFAADLYRWGVEHALGRNDIGSQTRAAEIMWWGLPPVAVQPAFASLSSPEGGFAILRSDWSHNASYLLLQFTSSSVHVHSDRSFGALYLFDRGPWMIGNGYDPASVDRTPTWQHSTLGMDGASQTASGGRQVAFTDLEGVGLAAAEGEPYAGRVHRRTVAWLKDWHQWLVWDDVGAYDGKPHTLQLRWYVRGTIAGASDNVWTFRQREPGAALLQIVMFPAQPATYREIARHYAGWEEPYTAAVGVEMDTTSRQERTRLVTSLTTLEDPPLVTRSDVPGGSVLSSVLNTVEWKWFLPSVSGAAEFEEGRVQGLAACTRTAGSEMHGYCLIQGMSFTLGGQPLVTAATPVSVEANIKRATVTADSPAPVELTLYWPSTVARVLIGGESVAFSQTGDLVTISLPAGQSSLLLAR